MNHKRPPMPRTLTVRPLPNPFATLQLRHAMLPKHLFKQLHPMEIIDWSTGRLQGHILGHTTMTQNEEPVGREGAVVIGVANQELRVGRLHHSLFERHLQNRDTRITQWRKARFIQLSLDGWRP